MLLANKNGCSFFVVNKIETKGGMAPLYSYGIKVTEDGFNDLVIENVTNDYEYAKKIMEYLAENRVSREHIWQVIEEILCGWVF